MTIGTAPPGTPVAGDFWWDSTGGNLYVWYNDGTSTQWVPASIVTGPPGAQGVPGPTAVSADAGNMAKLGSDSLLYVPAGMRNLAINGLMDVDQRNSHGAAIACAAGALTFGADRFWAYATISGTLNVNSSQTAILADGPTHVLQVSVVALVPSLAATDAFELAYRIEGQDFKRLNWGTANARPLTISFWAAASATGVFSFAVNNGQSSVRSYATSYNLTANTWTKFTITIPGDTAGTWVTDTGLGCQLSWGFGFGSSYVGTGNVWQSASIYAPPGCTNFMNTATGYVFEIAIVQIEVGSVATPYEQRPIGLTTALCQRYYWQTNFANLVYNNQAASAYVSAPIKFPVTMRASPIKTFAVTPSVTNETLDGCVVYQLIPTGTWMSPGLSTFSSEL
jgi:hypothetical protein